jgi:ribosomal protein S18 acetylase RimI-like enzyme
LENLVKKVLRFFTVCDKSIMHRAFKCRKQEVVLQLLWDFMEESDSDSDSGSEEDHCREVVVRKARLCDVDRIAEIFAKSFEFLDVEDRDWIEGVVRKRSRRARIYVSLVNSDVAGFVLLYKKGDKAYIDAFAVDQRYRGMGVGKCLLRHVENILASEGVEKLYLTVKNGNSNALGMYIKHGYRIANTVLILESLVDEAHNDESSRKPIPIKIIESESAPKSKVKLLDTALWANFTWDIDSVIYKTIRKKQRNLIIYVGKRLAGIATISLDRDRTVIERLAVSYYKPSESIKIVIGALKSYVKHSELGKTIRIPVDSTKATLLQALITAGFRIADSEYILYKDLAIESLHVVHSL